MMKLFPTILLFVITILSCNKSDNTNQTKNKSSVQVINLDTTESKLNYKFYQKMNIKTRTPDKPIKDDELKSMKSYYKVGYNEKNQIMKIIHLGKKHILFTITFQYNNRGVMIQSNLYANTPGLGNSLSVSNYNQFNKEIVRKIYSRKKNKYILINQKEFNQDEKVILEKDFDEKKRLSAYYKYKYKNGVLYSKTCYQRDIKLMSDDEEHKDYYKELYLDYIDIYNKDGRLHIKKYFRKEEAPNKLYFWEKYTYEHKKTIIERYNDKNRKTKRTVEDDKGKVIDVQNF